MLLCFHIVLAPSACFVCVFILVVSFHFENSGSYCKDVGAFSAGHIVTNLGVDMARFTQFPLMITQWAIIYEIISPGAAGSSIYV